MTMMIRIGVTGMGRGLDACPVNYISFWLDMRDIAEVTALTTFLHSIHTGPPKLWPTLVC